MTVPIHAGIDSDAAIRNRDDIFALEKTPWQESIPARNTYDLLCQACERYAENTALRFVLTGNPGSEEFTLSYSTLRARVTQAANAFHRAGIDVGKAVTLLLPNLPQTHYALLGAQAAGIASPVNPMLDVDYIARIAAETRTEALVTLAPMPGSDLWDKAVEVIDRCPSIRTVFVVSIAPYADAPTQTLLSGLWDAACKPQRRDVRVVKFDDALAAEPEDALVSGRRIGETDLCSYFHTGGTTGLPKVAAHTHLNEAFVAWALNALQPGPLVLLCGLPLFHVNGAMVTGLAAFHAGSEVVMLTPAGYRGEGVMQHFWKLVERFRASTFSGVPTIYAALSDLPVGDADLSTLRYAICGAAPLPLEVARRFEAVAHIPLCEGYGLTEGACVSAFNPPCGERRLGSVGLPLPHQQMKIWKVDGSGNATGECAPGEIGVIGICGPNVFPGYLRDQDNCGIWLAPGWFNSGDLGYLDDEGYLRLTGRAKELIIRGGHNIDPAMIEDALQRHPAVAIAAAVSQPDAYAGELPVAYVTLKKGCTAQPEQLLAFARETIPERAAVPMRVEILQQMALTAVGKVAKQELRRRAAEHVLRQILARHDIPAEVEIRQDIRRGMAASVQCAVGSRQRVRELLASFPMPVDVSAPA
jgi:fatty-acyl-CoA synthase